MARIRQPELPGYSPARRLQKTYGAARRSEVHTELKSVGANVVKVGLGKVNAFRQFQERACRATWRKGFRAA
jgi:hypothetical protein